MSVTFAAGVNSALQLTVAPEMRGRVMALYSVVFIGSTPIGGPVTGWLSSAAGPRAGLVMGGIAAVAAGIVAQRAFTRGIAATRPPEADAPAVALATAGEGPRRAGGKSMYRRGLSIGLRHRMDDDCTSNYFHQHQRSPDVRHRHEDHTARRNVDG